MRKKLSKYTLEIGYLVIGIGAYVYSLLYEMIWDGAGWEELSTTTSIIIGAAISIAIAFTVVYYSKKQQRKFEEFLKNLDSKKSQESQTSLDKKIDKNLISAAANYVGYLSVPATIAFALGVSIAYLDQPITILTVFLGSISIGLAIAIFAIQQSQGATIKELIHDVRDINKEQHELIEDVREAYADSIINWVCLIHLTPNHVKNIYEKYVKGQSSFNNEGKQNAIQNIVNNYSRSFQIQKPKLDTIEMFKIFGKKIAIPWHVFSIKCSIEAENYLPDSDEGIKLLLDHYYECLNESRTVTDLLLQYASERSKDDYQKKVVKKLEKEGEDE